VQEQPRPVPAPPVPGPPVSSPSGESADPIASIDVALAGLDRIEDRPVAEHVALFDAAHVALTAALSSIDKV